jgi:diguanylate cyclase
VTGRYGGVIEPILIATCGTTAIATASAVLMHRRAVRAERTVARLDAELDTQRRAASHDPLTGLLNRRAFHAAAHAVLTASARPPLAALVVDIDHFKLVNDYYGHAAGDHVLATVAQRLSAFAGGDPAARVGGDEFAALLRAPTSDPRWLERATRHLTGILAEPIPLGYGMVRVTAAVGLAPVGDAGLAEALRQADAAMYRAKLVATAPRHLFAVGVGA